MPAARSAIEDYGAGKAKVHVVPFGANLYVEPSREQAEALVAMRPRHQCRLLFIGVNWFRKGGDLALALASRLTEQGMPTKLTVIGCEVPRVSRSGLGESLGPIDKSTPSGEGTIARVLGQSHFLCLPSRADCTPVVLCEASAYRVPSLSVRTGGIGSVITPGVNGYLSDRNDFVDSAAESIARCMATYDDVYVPLALSSHEEYRSRLNWTTASKLLVQHLSRLVAERR